MGTRTGKDKNREHLMSSNAGFNIGMQHCFQDLNKKSFWECLYNTGTIIVSEQVNTALGEKTDKLKISTSNGSDCKQRLNK